MRAAIGVMLNALDAMDPWGRALEIDDTYSSLMPASAMPYSDSTRAVTSTAALTFLCERQRPVRPSLPEMVIDRAL